MLVTPEHTLEDISAEFQEQFPYFFLMFTKALDDGINNPLAYSNTVPDVGIRIKKPREIPVRPTMKIGKFLDEFQRILFLNAHICYVSPDKKVHIAGERQSNLSLEQLSISLSGLGYIKHPGTNNAHIDANEKRNSFESLELMEQCVVEEDTPSKSGVIFKSILLLSLAVAVGFTIFKVVCDD